MSVRVLHVITGLGRGGAEAMLVKMADTMRSFGVDSRVVSVKDRGALANELERMAIQVDSLHLDRATRLLGAVGRLRAIVREARPDLVQGWMYHGNLLATLAGRAGKVPVAWGIRQSLYRIDTERPTTRAVIRIGAALSRYPGAIVYNSDVGLSHHIRAGFRSDRARVIPNGFNTDAFRPDRGQRRRCRSEWGVADDHEVILLPARWHPVKDHATFLAAARLVVARRPSVRFVLAGTDIDNRNTALVELIRNEGLESCVVLLGEVAAMAGVYAAADIVCLSSTNEGFPNVLGEALATEVPCVTTDVGDARAVVGDAGLVVPPRDSSALASACLELLESGPHARHRLGAAGRVRVLDQYRVERVAEQFANLYRCLVRGGGSGA